MLKTLKRLWRQQCGQNAAEYALLVVGIALVVVAVLYAYSGSTNRAFHSTSGAVMAGASGGSGGGGSPGGGGGTGGGGSSGGGGGQTGGGSGGSGSGGSGG